MTDNIRNSTICPAAWVAAAVQPSGVVVPCCGFIPDEKFKEGSTLNKDFLNNDLREKMRNSMLNSNSVSGCQNCYKNESLGTKSMRQGLIKWFGTPNQVQLRFLEITFSNKCNLACVSCDAINSSKWAAEDAKHNRVTGVKFLKPNNLNLEHVDLSELTVLKLIGGEPLLEQKKFIEVLEKLNLSNLTLTLTTNGTIALNDKLADLIVQCKAVHLYISIDGIRPVNEWYRWPTNHTTVENNIKTYLNWATNHPNIQIASHTVINVYNIWTLGDFISNMIALDAGWIFDFDFIDEPNWQSISNIPEIFKNDLIEKLLYWSQNIFGNWNNNQNPFLDSIKQLQSQGRTPWKETIYRSLKLANERNLNLFDHVPALEDKFSS